MSESDLLSTVARKQVLDDVLEIIYDEWLMQGRGIRNALEKNESNRALMSLGGEIVCESLERRILNRAETRQRLANEKLGLKRVVPSDAEIEPPKAKIGSHRFHRTR